MKIFLASLTISIGLALVGPALAADQVATGKPIQLSQQPAQKSKQAKKDTQRKGRAAEAGAKAKVVAKSKSQER